MTRLAGIRDLVERFDDFLVDLWGVVHDGQRPYDGAIGALEALAACADKRVLFVTNTSRAADRVVEMLVGRMAIGRGTFVDVVSSGDVTRAALLARDPDLFGALPERPRCFHAGDPSFVPWLFQSDLALDMVDDPSAAEIVVASGAPRGEEALATLRAVLAPLASRSVPLVCTNPDRIIPTPGGAMALGPGAVAQAYAADGGSVFLYGKPHPPIYEAARRRLGGFRRTVAIGDLLETDIRGARTAKLPSVLVTRGAPTSSFDDEVPDMIIERFAW